MKNNAFFYKVCYTFLVRQERERLRKLWARPLSLDIGGGHKPISKTGWRVLGDTDHLHILNADKFWSDCDIKMDFNHLPYPFRDNTFYTIFARHTLEHVKLGMIIDVMKEIHRISKSGARVCIQTPYFFGKGYAADPTHQTPFTEDTFAAFAGLTGTDFYIPKLFDILNLEYIYNPHFWFIPKFIKKPLRNFLNEIVVEIRVTYIVRK